MGAITACWPSAAPPAEASRCRISATACSYALEVLTVGFTAFCGGLRLKARDARLARRRGPADARSAGPRPPRLGIGFLTDFLDTLGIGSFAVTTALFKLFKTMPDEDIPGSLNVGHSIPTFAEAFIFIAIVAVEGRTLVLMILASVLGAWLGAGYVASWSRRKIQIGMGVALLTAAALFSDEEPRPVSSTGGDALGLTGTKLLARRLDRQFHLRRADDARYRRLRALHDPRQPARHEPGGRVPHHDGLLRLPDARGQPLTISSWCQRRYGSCRTLAAALRIARAEPRRRS